MAEEILAGELRMGHSRYDSDWRTIERNTQRATKSISDAINSIGRAGGSTPQVFSRLNSELAKTQQAMSRTGSAATAMGRQISGIRPDAAGLKSLNSALNTSRDAMTKAGSAASELSKRLSSIRPDTSGLDAFNQTLRNTQNAMGGASKGTGGLSGAMGVLKGTVGATILFRLIDELGELASEAVRSGEAMVGIRIRLESLMGSSYEASKALAFVREQTTRLGQSTIEGSKAFARIAAAAEGTKAEGEGVELIFKGITTATTGLGLSAAETSRILLQLTQSMNKGKFQGEELNTMAENGIPAMLMLAKAMGVTRDRLAEMLQAGDVSSDNALLLAEQMIIDFTASAEKMSQTVPAGFRRMAQETKNELSDMTEALFTSQTVMQMFNNTAGTVDFLPSVAVTRAWIDEMALQLNEFIAIASIYFLKVDAIIKTIWDSTIGFVKTKTKEAIDAWREALAPVDKFFRATFDTVFDAIMPQAVKDMRAAWLEMTGAMDLEPTKAKLVDDLGEISDSFEGVVDVNEVSRGMREFRLGLEKLWGIEGLDLLDATKLADAMGKSGDAISPKLQAILKEIRDNAQKNQDAMTASQAKAGKERLAAFKDEASDFAREHKALYDEIVSDFSDGQGRMTATQASEAKRRLKNVEEAIEREKTFYIELDEVADQAMQGPDDNTAWLEKMEARQRAAEAYKNELIEIDMYQDELSQYPKGEGQDIDAFRKSVQDTGGEAKKTVENLITNIQEGIGDILSEALRGDLDNISDVFDTIKDIALDVFADIASAFVIKPIVTAGLTSLLGGAFMKSGDLKDLGGAMDGLVDKIKAIKIPLPGGGSVTGGQVARGIAGIATGIGVGYGVSQATGGGMLGSILGGAAGGAITGAILTAPAGGITAPIGAIIGAVVGAIGGLVAALTAGAKDVKAAIAPLTTPFAAGPPTENVAGGGNAIRRGPFGFISLVGESSGGVDPGTIATIIAESDSAMAKIMTSRMREVAAEALQGQHFALDAREIDDAVAQTIQTRAFIMLRSILAAQGNANPEATAINVVGEPYSGTSENIDVVTKRFEDAVAILKLVEEIRIGPLGELESAIRGVNEQFSLLSLRARELGLDEEADVIDRERQDTIGEMSWANLEGLQFALAEIEEPAKASAMALEANQKVLWDNAVAADAVLGGEENRNAAQRLFAAQWGEHARKYGADANGMTAATIAVTQSMNDFIMAGASPMGQQMAQLQASYIAIRDEAVRLGQNTDALTAAYEQQRQAMANVALVSLEMMGLSASGDEAGAALLGLNMEVLGWKQTIDDLYARGVITEAQWIQAGKTLADYNEAQQENIAITKAAAEAEKTLAIARGDTSSDPYAPLWASIEGLTISANIAAGTISQVDIEIAALETQAYNLGMALWDMLQDGAISQEQYAAALTDVNAATGILIASTLAAAQAQEILAIATGQSTDAYAPLWSAIESFMTSADLATGKTTQLDIAMAQNAETAGNLIAAILAMGSAFLLTFEQVQSIIGQIRGAQRSLDLQALQDNGRTLRPESGRMRWTPPGSFFQRFEPERERLANERRQEAERRQQEDAQRRDGARREQEQREEQSRREGEQRREEARRNAESRQREASQRRESAQREAEQRRESARREAEQRREEAKRAAEQRREDRKRVAESIEGFVSQGKSRTSQSLLSLKNEFEELRDEAKRLGVGTGALTKAYKQQRAEIIRQARLQFQEALYGFTNPFRAAMIGVNEQVREFNMLAKTGIISRRDARIYQREATRNARFEEASRIAGGGGNAVTDFFEQIREFQQVATRSDAAQQIFDLTRQYKDLMQAMRFLGESTAGLTRSYLRQVEAVRHAAKLALVDAVDAITDPFAAAIRAIHYQLVDFQRQVAEGILNRREVERWRRAAMDEALVNRAQMFAQGEYNPTGQLKTPRQKFYEGTVTPFLNEGRDQSDFSKRTEALHKSAFQLMMALNQLGDKNGIELVIAALHKQVNDIRLEAHAFVNAIIDGFGNPFTVAMTQADAQIKEVQRLLREGLILQGQSDWATRMIQADTLAQEALRRISGGPVNSIEEVANAFDSFIRTGNPMSEAGQKLFDLTETFVNLVDAAHLLKMSTGELQQSYLEQAKVIREEGIAAIEDQLSAQIDGINAVKDYLDSLKISAEQPGNVQISESQRLFNEALAGTDIQKMVSAADDLRARALDYYGTTAGFYAIENSIIGAMETIRAREEAAVAAERERLTQQLEREIRQLEISTNSLDQLWHIRKSMGGATQGIDELIALARAADTREVETNSLLRRLVQQLKA
jgi:tape measure domain-containing protein